jgi:allantoate deiminase
MQRIEALAKISDDPNCLTRTFCSPAMGRANALVGSWMRQAGMSVRIDAIGNLIGHYPGNSKRETRNSKVFLLGSHLDTVRNAGKFDGPLGVLVAIACVQHFHDSKTRFPFDIAVVGFADEEGIRYQSTYLGSKALAGTFNPKELKRRDSDGISMADAVRRFGGKPEEIRKAKLDRRRLLGYAEVHIEQGPVLEKRNLSVGVVNAIAGQVRMRLNFIGRAGHAGTTPMNLRRDALCAAAEFISGLEAIARRTKGLVATVGEITSLPGASNVIPGEVRTSVDVRHPTDAIRNRAISTLRRNAVEISRRRKIKVTAQIVHQAAAIRCDERLTASLTKAAKQHQKEVLLLPSGAGHDAAAMAAVTPVAMLFVQCKGGVSHHPEESVRIGDIDVAISVARTFIEQLADQVHDEFT